MKTRLAIPLVIALMAIAASGCWHKKSPQQQYTEALMRGNSMQASQVWLNMSAEDRMKFARGEGIKPDASSGKDAQQQIMNHYRDEMGEEGPSTAEEMEQQISTPLGTSLKQLPGASGSSSPNN